MVEAVSSFETSVSIYQTASYYIQEDSHLQFVDEKYRSKHVVTGE
jgi:hypothetical protein